MGEVLMRTRRRWWAEPAPTERRGALPDELRAALAELLASPFLRRLDPRCDLVAEMVLGPEAASALRARASDMEEARAAEVVERRQDDLAIDLVLPAPARTAAPPPRFIRELLLYAMMTRVAAAAVEAADEEPLVFVGLGAPGGQPN